MEIVYTESIYYFSAVTINCLVGLYTRTKLGLANTNLSQKLLTWLTEVIEAQVIARRIFKLKMEICCHKETEIQSQNCASNPFKLHRLRNSLRLCCLVTNPSFEQATLKTHVTDAASMNCVSLNVFTNWDANERLDINHNAQNSSNCLYDLLNAVLWNKTMSFDRSSSIYRPKGSPTPNIANRDDGR